MPTISEISSIPNNAKMLEVLVSDWAVNGTMTMEGNAVKVAGKWKFSEAVGGWGLKATMKMELAIMRAYLEDDMVGFDPGEGKFHVFGLTNTAAAHSRIS
jgi:hypothetical protein